MEEEKKIEICKICKEKGEIVELKGVRGLGLHLRVKHNMKLDEYREKYEKESVIKTTEEEMKEQLTEESETSKDEPQIVVKDYQILNNSNLSAMFVHDNGVIKEFKKVMAVGTVEFGDDSVVSVLVIDDNGILNPPLWLPNFGRITENDTSKQPDIKVKKNIKSFFHFGKKKKEEKKKVKLGKEESEALSEKLMETLQQFSKEKEEEKNKM